MYSSKNNKKQKLEFGRLNGVETMYILDWTKCICTMTLSQASGGQEVECSGLSETSEAF